MWLADLALVAGVIVLVSLAVAVVVWIDNRLDRDRPGGNGGGGAGERGRPSAAHRPPRRLRRTSDTDDRR